jgi:hypothetical protein
MQDEIEFSEKYQPLFELLEDSPAYKDIDIVLISGGR